MRAFTQATRLQHASASEEVLLAYRHMVGPQSWAFADLRDLMAKATPIRSGDMLAGIAASSAEESVAARMCLADVPLNKPLFPSAKKRTDPDLYPLENLEMAVAYGPVV